MKLLSALLLIVSLSLHAKEVRIGTGYLFKADTNRGEVYSVAITDSGYSLDYIKWSSYSRAPWYGEHPEWGTLIMDGHSVVSLTKDIYTSQLTSRISFFASLGLAYSDRLSRVNSSHILFRENLGFSYRGLRVFWRHTSNAGIVPPNTGEDAIAVDFTVSKF